MAMINKLAEAIKELHIDTQQKYLDWIGKWAGYIKKEAKIDYKTYPRYKRGDIVLIEFGKNLGMQFSGPHYAMIVREVDMSDGNITVIPLTSKKYNNYNKKYNVDIGKILDNNKETIAKIEQITTLSKIKILRKKPICKIRDNEILNLIDDRIKKVYLKNN